LSIPHVIGSSAEELRYIHGGGWRDPEVDSQSFEPAVNELLGSSIKDQIAGFASVNYRLSPHPSHPAKPSSPDDPSRNVHYPSHLQDVGHALLYLEEEYQIANRYVLVGHSAGATIAFELNNWYIPDKVLPLPAAILGIAGIYNFEAFIQAHSGIPLYREFMENAFPLLDQWEKAAPYTSRLPDQALWEQVQTILISHSDEDELVEKEQATFMLERALGLPHGKEKVHFLEANGNHDEIWESGPILADLIIKAVDIMRARS
jgi:kynurenine formamidase